MKISLVVTCLGMKVGGVGGGGLILIKVGGRGR
jgi:hypothetical protein